MALENNAYCDICGKEYYLCMHCAETKNLTPWKIFTDTAEHYKIYQVLKGYTGNVYTKEEAKEKLSKIDLSDLDTFREKTKKCIEEILANDKIQKEVKKDESKIETENVAKPIVAKSKVVNKK